MRKPRVGDEIQYGINRFKISRINNNEVRYTNGMSDSWEDVQRMIWAKDVAVFRGEEVVKLK